MACENLVDLQSWKDSPLALCYYGGRDDIKGRLADLVTAIESLCSTISGGGGGGAGYILVQSDNGTPTVPTINEHFPNGWVTDLGGGSVSVRPPQPDTPPITANAKDDEFDAVAFDDSVAWTALNQGGMSVNQARSIAQFIINSEPSAGHRLRMFTKPVPVSTPYYVTVKAFKDSRPDRVGGQAIAVRNSSNGKLVSMHLHQNAGTAPTLEVVNWTDANTQASVLLSIPYYQTANYMRVYNDGTYLYFGISQDGYWFDNIAFPLISSFIGAVNQVGIGFYSYDQPVTVGFDYFRVTP